MTSDRSRSRSRSRKLPFALAFALALALSACSDVTADAPTVERTDSAGIAIVKTLGPDRPLDWTFTPTLDLGGANEGPESFFAIGDWTVTADAVGNIYVLDRAAHRVVVFDSTGNHLRSVGSQGGGPGEFEQGYAMDVRTDGTIGVFDISKNGLVLWGPGGEILPTEPVPENYSGSAIALTDAGLVFAVNDAESTRLKLIGDTVTELAAILRPEMKPVEFECVAMSAMAPVLAPALVWKVNGDRTAITAGTAYSVDVTSSGETTSLRRDFQPRSVTPEMAALGLPETGMTVNFGGGRQCVVPPEDVVSERGFAPILQAIEDLALSPDGSTWVKRNTLRGEPEMIDIFNSEGVYLGTLPADSPWPVAFTPNGDIIAIETDDLDIDHLITYKITR